MTQKAMPWVFGGMTFHSKHGLLSYCRKITETYDTNETIQDETIQNFLFDLYKNRWDDIIPGSFIVIGITFTSLGFGFKRKGRDDYSANSYRTTIEQVIGY
jgi:hypothetical protein